MAIPAGAGGFSMHRRVQPSVLCASCGTRFDADGATTGDRLRCPLCAEVVELDDVHAERHLYRSRTALTFSDPRQSAGRRRRRSRVVTPVALIALAWVAYFAFCLAYPELSPAALWNQFKHW